MGVMPFLATCHACELLYCMIFLFLFEWRIKFSVSLTQNINRITLFSEIGRVLLYWVCGSSRCGDA